MHAGDVWVGLDLGTSAVKAVALRGDGAVLARASTDYPTERPVPGASEQDPGSWRRACAEVVAQLRDAVRPSAWRGIGLSAMIPTLVVLDQGLEPLAPAVTWEDARAEREGERLRRAVGAEWLYERTGQWLDGRYLLPMYARLAAAEPGLAPRVRHLAGAKDLLFAWLTGELVTDPSTAAGFGAYDVRAGVWLEEPLRSLELELAAPLPLLPRVEPSTSTRPLIASAAATLGLPAGLPICLGAADSVLGALGLGADSVGDVAYIAGTSSVVLGIAARFIPDAHHRYLITPLADSGAYGLEMDLLATGSAVRWLARLLDGVDDEAQLIARGGALDPAAAPVFLPYLAPGEQGALWNAELHGTVLGLHLGHDAAHIARGLLNGIVLESRRCLEALSDAGLPAGRVRLSGWCAAAAGVRSDLADCCRRQVRAAPSDGRDCSAIGAARLLARTLGDTVATPAEPDLDVCPIEERSRVWDGLWERHERALEVTAVVYEPTEALCTDS
ncbi:MAG TPA: FGGY family carbohydrate kinase [Solirubrobacteraceae bacterium]|nr:FGGY family carbohydrate kinase [Solirubrobacteraceae bacterium]